MLRFYALISCLAGGLLFGSPAITAAQEASSRGQTQGRARAQAQTQGRVQNQERARVQTQGRARVQTQAEASGQARTQIFGRRGSRGRYSDDGYWNNYWNWYDGTYRPYYHRRYQNRSYRYDNDGYNRYGRYDYNDNRNYQTRRDNRYYRDYDWNDVVPNRFGAGVRGGFQGRVRIGPFGARWW